MKKKLEPMHDQHVNVTPLIDVVMCLIIFFLLCGQLAKDQSVHSITIPSATRGQDIQDKEGMLIINVVPKYSADNKPLPGEPDYIVRNVTYTAKTLPVFLRQQEQENKNLKVIIRADQATQYQYVEPVLTGCMTASIKNVDFQTQNEE